jgi:hypothetical protein
MLMNILGQKLQYQPLYKQGNIGKLNVGSGSRTKRETESKTFTNTEKCHRRTIVFCTVYEISEITDLDEAHYQTTTSSSTKNNKTYGQDMC